MTINSNDCPKNLQCWECNEICSIKASFSLPENLFMRVLNEIRAPYFADLMLSGYTMKQADAEVNIMILTIYTARKKFLESHKK